VFPQVPGARIRGLGLRRTSGGPAVAGLQTAKGQTFGGLVSDTKIDYKV